jgi:TATA-binding protein-associated factor
MLTGTTTEADAKMESNDSTGQNLVDACTLIQAVVPHIDPSLYPRIAELFPSILLAVTSRFALIRLLASQCMATLCDVITTEAMLHIVEHAVLLLGDLTVLANRQGSMELISRTFSSFACR